MVSITSVFKINMLSRMEVTNELTRQTTHHRRLQSQYQGPELHSLFQQPSLNQYKSLDLALEA